jgi:hypothetical protein
MVFLGGSAAVVETIPRLIPSQNSQIGTHTTLAVPANFCEVTICALA